MSPPLVLMPQGPKKLETGSLVVCLAPRPNSKVRCAATGIFDRSGFGQSTAGTWLLSGLAGSRAMRNSRKRPTQGSSDLPARASRSERSSLGLRPFSCSVRFTIQTLSPIL
ncbi:hypothetical protein D3C81_1857820 [compost metagenome]